MATEEDITSEKELYNMEENVDTNAEVTGIVSDDTQLSVSSSHNVLTVMKELDDDAPNMTSKDFVEDNEIGHALTEEVVADNGSQEIVGSKTSVQVQNNEVQDDDKQPSVRGVDESEFQHIEEQDIMREIQEVIRESKDVEENISAEIEILTRDSEVYDVTKQGDDDTKSSKVLYIGVTEDFLSEEEKIILPDLIDTESTERMPQSTGSRTDSERPARNMNTHAQNTPNQDVVTVKFVANPDITFAHAFNLGTIVREIKEKMSKLLHIDAKFIMLSKNGYDIDDWLPLAGLGVEAFGCIELMITSSDPNQKITGIVDNGIPSIDAITVHVLQDDGSFKDVIVEIHDEAYCKRWLGGYRNKKTNVDYHHTCTQTLPKPRKVHTILDNLSNTKEYFLFQRDTHAPWNPKSIGVDTPANKATQMHRSDCVIPSKDDKIITAKQFETYDEWMERNKVIEKILKIQRAVRKWIFKREHNKKIALEKEMMQNFQDEKLQILHDQVDKKRVMITSAAFPSKRDDFYMLYLMVGKWWQKEFLRIKDLRTEETLKAELCGLLEKEITLLSAIEKHRIEVKKESLRKQEMRFLNVTSKPIIFKNARGEVTAIDDLPTQKAREFKEIYSTLISKELSSQERIDFLLTFKNMMASYKDYEYTKDIVNLIEKEINLRVIGIKGKDLEGLGKRIELLFMHFLQKPQFNPKAKSYRRPNWPRTVDILYKCTRCSKLLPVSGYPVHTRMTKLAICKSCEWLQNIGHQRIDMSPYLRLLKQVQNSEMQQNCYSSVCFVLQQTGVYFLVNTVWHGHSIISECKILSNLRLVRWIKSIEWSPWNNILLTEEEAKCHNNIENVLEFYDPMFIDSVKQKHILTRIHFFSLFKTDILLRNSKAWDNNNESGSPMMHSTHIDAFIQGDD